MTQPCFCPRGKTLHFLSAAEVQIPATPTRGYGAAANTHQKVEYLPASTSLNQSVPRQLKSWAWLTSCLLSPAGPLSGVGNSPPLFLIFWNGCLKKKPSRVDMYDITVFTPTLIWGSDSSQIASFWQGILFWFGFTGSPFPVVSFWKHLLKMLWRSCSKLS